MSVEVDYIEIMRRALNSFRAWKESLDKLRYLIKDGCADTALNVALGGLDRTCTWLNNCILWEKEARLEKKIKEKEGKE